MKIATWNVNGLRARFEDLKAWLAASRPDVVCLQEIKATAAQVPEPLTGLPEYQSFWHGGPGGYSGVSLHVRRDFWAERLSFSSPSFDMEHRIVETELGDWVFASIYVPNGNKDFEAKESFLRGMVEHAGELTAAGKRVVLCGDLNVTRSDQDLHPKQRKRGAIGQTKGERALLQEVLDTGLVDTLRHVHPDDDTIFTWWPPWREEKKKNRGWRIDYVLVSDGLRGAIAGVEVLRDEGTSDHAPYEVILEAALDV
jgi:exodeoxyribonuclease-3